jgi:predicted ATPase
MELSYIWVSNFRNIHSLGFNLSSRYQFSFNAQDHLEIIEKSSYIPEFFGHNIKNVTGIVGENGAGKTNVLELINYVLDSGNTKVNAPFLLVFEEYQQFLVFEYRLETITCNRPIELQPYDNKKIPLAAIYFTNTFDGRRHDFGKKIHDLSTNKLLQYMFGENVYNNFKKEVQGQIDFLRSDVLRRMENGLPASSVEGPKLRPEYVQFAAPAWSTINNKARQFDDKARQLLNREYESLSLFCKSFRRKITDNVSSRSFLYFTAFLVYLDFVCNEFMPETFPPRSVSNLDYQNGAGRMSDEIGYLHLEELADARINEVFEIITHDVAKFIEERYPHTFEKTRFLFELNSHGLPSVEKLTEGTYTSRKFQFRSPYVPEMERFISDYAEATNQQSLNYSIEWLGISSGQRAFLNLFSRLYSVSGKIKEPSLMITIDEGDLYFHPKWQVEYLARLIWALPIIFEDKTIQLVLTTHSPFLVSDLTKSHLIFLRKDGDNNTQILLNERLEETFGGNIGELYLNAFFLDGNLISHFAADRIRNILYKLKNDKANFDGYDLRIVNQLGDKLIKYQLQQLLNDKDQ